MNPYEISDSMNCLSSFLGKRDIPTLSGEALENRYSFSQADVLVLCGSGLLCGADVLADAVRHHAAKVYIIAGGVGHTTPDLRSRLLCAFPDIPEKTAASASEAELFDLYLDRKYGLHADYLDCSSRNSGENILNTLKIVQEHGVPCKSMILCQDAALQLRMDASLRHYAPEILPINFAVYKAETCVESDTLSYRTAPPGMWDIPRFRSLLMGEIPRLSDTPDGYGPKGMNYLAHVDIPDRVMEAFQKLKKAYPDDVRQAICNGTNLQM